MNSLIVLCTACAVVASTNSNAYARNIVLHAHPCVAEPDDVVPGICQSDGCIMVSPKFLKVLASKIEAAIKPVLLSVYDQP